MKPEEELEILNLTKQIQKKLNHNNASIYQIIKYALEDLDYKVSDYKGD